MKMNIMLLAMLFLVSCQQNEKVNSGRKNEKILPFLLSKTESTEKFKENPNSDGNSLYKSNTLKFLSNESKKGQVFSLNSDSDTTLISGRGTVLYVPKEIFEFENGKPVPNGSAVKIVLKEYYDISEMIANNLSTVSNGKLLETRGMMYISASSENKNLRIKEGMNITVKLPAEKANGEMELFYGKKTSSGINWVPDNRPAGYFSYPNSISFRSIEKPYIADMKNFLSRLKYPEEAINADRKGKVHVICMVDKNGVAHNLKVLYNPSKYLKEEVLKKIENYKGFIPAKIDGKAVCSICSFTVEFVKYGFWKNIDVYESGRAWIDFRLNEFKPKDLIAMENKYCDECERIYNPNENVEISYKLGGYSLKISNLGFINCDRFINEPIISYMSIESYDNEGVVSFLVFKKIKSMVCGFISGKKIIYNNIPLNYDVTLVCVKEKGNDIYLAMNDFKTSKDMGIKLVYNKVTKEEFEKSIEKLN